MVFGMVNTSCNRIINISGNLTLKHAVIRQAVQCVTGDADGVRIINTDILACEQAVALTSGSRREFDTDALQPSDFVMRNSRAMYSNDGVVLTGVNSYKYFYISSSSFSHNQYGIRNWNWANALGEIETHLYVADCHIEANRHTAILDNTRSYVTVERTSLIGPSLWGYSSARRTPVKLSFRNSYFTGFWRLAVYSSCYDCISNWSFYNNQFVNVDENIKLRHDGSGRGHLNVEIVNNTFYGSPRYRPDDLYTMFIAVTTRDKVLVQNNTFDSIPGGITINPHPYGDNTIAPALLTENRFINIGPSEVAIRTRATVNITGNTFQNCTVPSLIELESGSDHVISENKFINNTMSSKCLLSVRENPYEPYSSIQANRNYWDSQDVSRIKGAICDFFLDSSRARVEMIEFYTSPDMSTTVNHHDDFRYEFRSDLNATVIGGVITSSSTISLDTGFGDKLIVNRSIIVEPGANVDLHSVVMEFAANRGMVVFGKTMYMYFVVALQHFY